MVLQEVDSSSSRRCGPTCPLHPIHTDMDRRIAESGHVIIIMTGIRMSQRPVHDLMMHASSSQMKSPCCEVSGMHMAASEQSVSRKRKSISGRSVDHK